MHSSWVCPALSDGRNSSGRQYALPHAHPRYSLRIYMRRSLGSRGRIYCSSPALAYFVRSSAVGMMFELAAYGFLSGLLYKLFPKKLPYIYLSLILAMIGGRAVLGAANVILYSFGETAYSWTLFMSGAFINAIPGIILQIVIIPPAVFALKRSRILKD